MLFTNLLPVGGSVVERLERCNCSSEAPSSRPALTACWIYYYYYYYYYYK